jgi:periplasmic copper chaperone A
MKTVLAMTPARCLLLGAAMLIPSLAAAQVTVTEAWVRGTVPGQRATGAFMTLASTQPVTLVAVRSPIATSAEIHEMKMDGGVMKMRAVERVPLGPNAPLKLDPGGYHLMLVGLAKPVAEGDKVAITLTFEDRSGKQSRVDVVAPVRPLTTGHGGRH